MPARNVLCSLLLRNGVISNGLGEDLSGLTELSHIIDTQITLLSLDMQRYVRNIPARLYLNPA